MGTPTRIGITVATALLLGADTYGHAFDHELPDGFVHDLWYGPLQAILFAAATLAAALVYRWWALLPALAPLAVEIYLHEMTDYVYPFHEDPYPALTVFGTFLLAAFLGVGLILRAIWELMRARVRRA